MFLILFLLIFSRNKLFLAEDSTTPFTKATGNYADDNYVRSNKINVETFTYSSNGDKDNYPITNAFNGISSDLQSWVAKNPNTDTFHNSILISFDKEAKIEAILHDASYSTKNNALEYNGFPLILKIYSSSSNDEPLRLQATFSGECPEQDNTWTRTQFILPNPIYCTRLQIEFYKVTPDNSFSDGLECPAANEIYLIGELQHYKSTFEKVKNNYEVTQYVNSHKITTDHFTFETTGDKNNFPKSNLFDGSDSTYWASLNPNTDSFKASIFVNFTETTSVEGIIYSGSYSTSSPSRTFKGFPYKLTVYTALKDRPLTVHTVFSGETPTTSDWDKTQFVFTPVIVCDRMQIEFTEVSPDTHTSNGALSAVSGGLELIKPEYGSLPLYPASGILANKNYVDSHKIATSDFTYSSNGDKTNFPLSYAFDGNIGSGNKYWVSNLYSNDFVASVFINFNRMVTLESILNYHAYGTNRSVIPYIRRFDGFPLVLKIYKSLSDEENDYELVNTFAGETPSDPSWTNTQYAFNAPIRCKRLKMEFVQVTPDNAFSGGEIRAVSNELIFIGTIDPPPPTPNPTQTPIPTRSPYPGSVDTYINQNFEGSFGVDQILTNTHNVRQISGCVFKNINIANKNYFIKAETELLFFDNIFENTQNPTTDTAAVLWDNYNGKITISNCKFIKIASKGTDGSVLNTNSPNSGSQLELVIEQTEFIDCGRSGRNYPLINHINAQGILKFYDCNFTFSNTDFSFRVFESYNNNAVFERCRFTNCESDTIKIGISGNDPIGTFIFRSNYVKSNKGRLILAEKLRAIPTIENNIFDSMTLSGSYLISITHNQGEIELTNNTFSHITTTGTTNTDCGGSGLSLKSSSDDYTIKYNKCKFYDISNNQETTPNCYGGALQYGMSTEFNAKIELEECEFKRNAVKCGHGGGVAIRTSKSVSIRGCIFESNTANNEGSSSSLLFSNHYEEKSKGFGGAVYINPSFNDNNNDYFMSSVIITGCIFKSNSAYQGYAIYVEGEDCDTTFLINNNQFNGNNGIESHINQGSIIASEILNINKDEIIQSNQFSNSDNNKYFTYVLHSGEPFPDPTPTPKATESPTQSATESPTQSATQSATESPTQSATQSATQSPIATQTPMATPTLPPVPIPESAPVPISVSIDQMIVTGDRGCDDGTSCPSDNFATEACGKKCWSQGDHFVSYEYTFIGEGFQVYGTYAPEHRRYAIYLDDELIDKVNQQIDGERRSFALQYTSNTLPYGEHKLKIAGIGEVYEMHKITYWPSLKSKRINSTEFSKTGEWIKESDTIGGIREKTNNNGATAKKTILLSKFWVIGTRNNLYNSMNVAFGDFEANIKENASGDERENMVVYESPYLPFVEQELIFTSVDKSIINCIYYLDEPAPATISQTPYATPTATQSPTQSATESPTQSATESPTQSATQSATQSPIATQTPMATPTLPPVPIPESAPVPISVSIDQMIVTGDRGCDDGTSCPSDNFATEACGKKCWSQGDHFVSYEYTFIGEGFQVYGTYAPEHRRYAIYLDDELIDKVDQQIDGERRSFALQYTSNTLPYGEHKLKIAGIGEVYEMHKITYWPSLKSKRINSTEFSKTGEWIKESDTIGGIREKTNNNGATAKKTILLSKFWVIGTRNNLYNSMNVAFGDFEANIKENASGDERENMVVYESPYLPFVEQELIFTSVDKSIINCIYYLDEPAPATISQTPYATPTATQSPTQSATESPTQSATQSATQSPIATQTPMATPTLPPVPIPESAPVPISVSIDQMIVTGDRGCDDGTSCPSDNFATEACGKKCWSQGDHFVSYEYTFIGEGFQVYGTYAPEHRRYAIYLDDELIDKVDQQIDGERRSFALQYTSNTLPYGEHKLKIAGIGEVYEMHKITYWPSLKSKRINSTEFSKTGEWIKESDTIGGIREKTNNNGATAKKTILLSKFWVIGTRNNLYNSMNVAFGDFEANIKENASGDERENMVVYESPYLPFVEQELIFTSVDKSIINCIYYLDEPAPATISQTPYATPTATQSPTQSATESPTQSATQSATQSPIATQTPMATPTLPPVPIPESAPVPISVSIDQMIVTGDRGCDDGTSCPSDNFATEACGKKCWSQGDHFVSYEYTFIGEGFQVYGTYAPEHRRYAIYLDDELIDKVDQQIDGERRSFALQYTSNTLPYGEHKLKIAGIGEVYEMHKITYWPSLKSKRINSTEFSKTGEWIKESDTIGGIREKTNNNGATAKKTILLSKFWVIGTRNNLYNSMNVAFGDFEANIKENASGDERENMVVYESPYLPFVEQELIFTSVDKSIINCIYYLDEPAPATISQTPYATPTATQSPTQSATESPTQSEALPDIIIVNPENTTDDRFELVVNDSSLIQVHINVSNFTNIEYNDNGGAIHLVNTTLECQNVVFTKCSTTNGGGGGIFVDNTYELKNPINLINLTFTECKANYGGAVYIHSTSYTDKVIIMGCIFNRNVADGTEGEGKKFGGSAVYLSARKGRLKSNKFTDNIGDTVVKVVNHFENNNKDKLSLLEVSECDFKTAKGTKNSLYYLRGDHGSKLQLNDCAFSGDLNPGSHHINGKEINKDSPKLMIKNCKFSENEKMNFISASLLSEDMKSQVFTDEKSSHDIRKESISKTWKIVTVTTVAVLLVSFSIIFIIKKSPSDQEEKDIEMQSDAFVL